MSRIVEWLRRVGWHRPPLPPIGTIEFVEQDADGLNVTVRIADNVYVEPAGPMRAVSFDFAEDEQRGR